MKSLSRTWYFGGILLTGLFSIKSLQATDQTSVKKLDQVIRSFSRDFKHDKSAQAAVQRSISSLSSIEELKRSSDEDPALKAELERVQKRFFGQILEHGDKAIPYLIQEYAIATRDRGVHKTELSGSARSSLEHFMVTKQTAIENVLGRYGTKSITMISDFQAKATKANMIVLAHALKNLLAGVIRENNTNRDVATTSSERDPEIIELPKTPAHQLIHPPMVTEQNSTDLPADPSLEDKIEGSL